MNLVNLIKDQLGGSVVNQIGGLLGESGADTERAVSGALPAILGGLVNKAGSSDGASALNKALDDHDDSILDNLGGLLGGGRHTQIANQGSSILGSLLGSGGLGSLAGALGKYSGFNNGGSAGSLIGMLAPIVMGVLRRQRNSQGLDAGGLANMLSGQRDNISAAMPAGLSDIMDREGLTDQLFGSVSNAAGNVTSTVSNVASDAASTVGDAGRAAVDTAGDAGRAAIGTAGAAGAAGVAAAGAATKSGGGLLRKLLPLLILALALWILWRVFAGGGAETMTDTVKNAGTAVTDTAQSAGSAVTDTAQSAAGAVSGMIPGDIGGSLGGMFDSAGETFGGITDVESAKAAIPGIEDMTGKLGGMASGFGALQGDAKSTVMGMVGEKMPMLQGLIDKAMSHEGVKDVLEPAANGLLDQLKAFGG